MRFLGLTLCLLAATLTTQAEVSLPKIFSSHMVLQRDMPIHVWGSAAAGEKITVEIHGLTASTSTDDGCIAVTVNSCGSRCSNGSPKTPR